MKNIFENYKNKSNTKSGFTLVEMIVSLGIFAIVAVVAAGALMKIMDVNKKAQSMQSAITNLNFALESMSRELRVGSKFNCTSNSNGLSGKDLTSHACTTDTDNIIIFRSSTPKISLADGSLCPAPYNYNLAYAYRFTDTGGGFYKLEKAEEPQGCSPTQISEGDYHPIISTSNVTITGKLIDVKWNNTTQPYPIASIRVLGFTGVNERSKTYFDIQTAASSRLP
jgi:prepilin-type N-terminal cleavage/methylation domain-containing protein